MTIGLFYNMNNSFFSIARYLRDRDAAVKLFLFKRESSHFHPSADTLSDDYKQYMTVLDWDKARHLYKTSAKQLQSVLDDCDVLVGCGAAPAYFHKAGRPADVLVPYGGDLVDMPFRGQKAMTPLSFRPSTLRKHFANKRFSHHQQEGIRQAKCIITELGLHGKQVARLGYSGNLIDHHFPAVYDYTAELRNSAEVGESEFGRKIRDLRETSSFIVFHHARHIWTSYIDELSAKGNDALIQGFAQFIKQVKDDKARLVLFDYGPDVEASKALIGKLGIDEHVVWMPMTTRKHILFGLLHCDVATGHFGLPLNLNGVTQEALVCGKPLIHSRVDSRHTPDVIASLYPVRDARTAEEIAGALEELYANPKLREEMGVAGRAWYHDVFVEGFFEHFWAALGPSAGANRAA